MPSLNDLSNQDPIKAIIVGRQGSGKTGLKASLIAAGYKVRTLDFDKGIPTLKNLLNDREHFPYYDFCRKNNIDIGQSSSIPIDQDMSLINIDRVHKDPNGRMIKTTK